MSEHVTGKTVWVLIASSKHGERQREVVGVYEYLDLAEQARGEIVARSPNRWEHTVLAIEGFELNAKQRAGGDE